MIISYPVKYQLQGPLLQVHSCYVPIIFVMMSFSTMTIDFGFLGDQK